MGYRRYPAQVTSPKRVAFLLGDLAVAVLDQIKPALKCYFSRLRAFAPLQYVDTAAVTTAQIHRKIPILRFYVVFTVKTWFNLVQNGYESVPWFARAVENGDTLRKMFSFSLVFTPRGRLRSFGRYRADCRGNQWLPAVGGGAVKFVTSSTNEVSPRKNAGDQWSPLRECCVMGTIPPPQAVPLPLLKGGFLY